MASSDEATLKFSSPCTVIMAGPTGSGKSTLLFKLLQSATGMFDAPPEKIYYCYGIRQSLFDDMERELSNVEFFDGLPSKAVLEQWASTGKHNIIVIDDLMNSLDKQVEMANLFCLYSHHMRFSVFLLVQNMYANSKYFRTMSLNTFYFILFQSGRDLLQVRRLASQMMRGRLSTLWTPT